MDRISDCLATEKAIGRSLAGKSLGVLSCGSDDEHVLGFFEPFKLTAAYLDMHYVGDVSTYMRAREVGEESKQRLVDFARDLQ